jgi:hypothetical protein
MMTIRNPVFLDARRPTVISHSTGAPQETSWHSALCKKPTPYLVSLPLVLKA